LINISATLINVLGPKLFCNPNLELQFSLLFPCRSILSGHFHRGEKQNKSHHKSYCKGCVHHYVMEAKLQEVSDEPEELSRCGSGSTEK
jgi:hypothetical protein